MSKNKHIRHSKYNSGALDFLQQLKEENRLTQWNDTKSKLNDTIRLITEFENHPYNKAHILSEAICSGSLNLKTAIRHSPVYETSKNWGEYKSISSINVHFTIPHDIDWLPTFRLSQVAETDSCSYIPSAVHKGEVARITENLRLLRIRLKQNFSRDLLFEIKTLVLQLRSLVWDQFKKQRKYVKKIRTRFRTFFVRNIRDYFRPLILALLKNLSDLSGCNEDINHGPISNCRFIFFNLTSNKLCLIQKNL